ncbi:MAG: hypothetical protein CL946_09690 [Ectothiorhodospiraceae bacterium]|nr:hypothetical protein [Ectothiorhodospiraceae bacterium]
MDSYLLTFETNEEGNQVFVHGDPAGLEYFAKQLLEIAAKAKAGEFPHDHYFTEEWGGSELSSGGCYQGYPFEHYQRQKSS